MGFEVYWDMAGVNRRTIKHNAIFVLIIILGFYSDFIIGRPTGAPPSSCTTTLTPLHGRNPQTSESPYSLVPETTVYGSTTQRITVTVSWQSGVFLRGLILQARPVGQSTPVGTWSIGTSEQGNFKLMRCDHDYDTVTHSNNNDKTSSITFSWHPPSTSVGNINFIASFVQANAIYWVQVYSAAVIDPCFTNPCAFGGLCNPGDTSPTYTCTCPTGLTGPNCNSCTNCFNNGICTPTSASAYTCACPNGFTGIRCETNLCNPNPCRNSGVCLPTSNGFDCQCSAGFTGTLCETISQLNGCDSNPCENGGTCFRGNAGTYVCQCDTGYAGTNCESVTANPCDSSPCDNEGTCYSLSDDTTYLCQCKEGFTGLTCSMPSDACSPDSPCQNGATCVVAEQTTLGFICVCSGSWLGTLCERESPCEPNPCYFGSTCLVTNNDRGYNCNCMADYTGSNCETLIEPNTNPCSSNPCENGGNCFQSDNTDPPTYFCDCTSTGYTGTNCATPATPCLPDPCQNAGTCRVVDSNTYHCTCTPLYGGINCETMINPCAQNPCLNNGACSIDGTSATGYTCACGQYFGGDRCQWSSCVSLPCKNGGTCTSGESGFTCECTTLYSGPTCEQLDIDPCQLNPCGDNGQCTSSGTTFECDCNLGWTGVRCDAPACTTGICQNGGTCIPSDTVNTGYTCSCLDTFTGLNCEYPAPCYPNPCMNGGQCSSSPGSYSFSCTCPPTHTGTLCGAPVPCNSNPCMNGGQCMNSPGSDTFTCTCPETHMGTTCDIAVNPCDPSPCMNGGTCQTTSISGTLGYTCACLNVYEGDRCEIFNPCSLLPCKNGGQCTTDGMTFLCTCPPTHSGTTCETVVTQPCDPSPCLNGGACQPHFSGTGFVCFCSPPFSGLICSDRLPPCASGPCQNGGACSDTSDSYTCECPSTHSGDNCEITVVDVCDSGPCQNSGFCESNGNSYLCRCVPPYVGRTCSDLNPCLLSNNCINGGTCMYNGVPGTFACSCSPGYSGNTCEIGPCTGNPCRNDGSCYDNGEGGYVCTCQIGFLGTDCDIVDTTCSINNACSLPGGTCTLTGPQQYRCDCNTFYSGDNCEIFSDPCENRGPCVTGTCLNLGDSYTCVCGDGYEGELCDKSVCTGTESGCLNGGVCNSQTQTCECAFGFTGTDCSTTVSVPPVFDNCPDGDLMYSLQPGTIIAVITQQTITAKDTRGTPLPVTQESGPDFVFDGELEVTFEEAYREGVEFDFSATDFASETSNCIFKIKLVDNEVPTVECPADIREVTTESTLPVMFEVTSTNDNLGEPTVTYSRTIQDQEIPVSSGAIFEADGLPKSIIVNAKDSFDNEAFCQFTVTVYRKDMDCAHFPDVDNGVATCDINMEGNRECSVTCNSGYFLSVPSPAKYTCRQSTAVKETTWQPTPKADSICVAISEGKLMKTVTVIFGIEAEDCAAGDGTFENSISTDIIMTLSDKGLCTLKTINACDRDNYEINCGDSGNTRRRRAITDLTVGIGVSGRVDGDTNATSIQTDIDMLAEQIRILADSGELMVDVNGVMIPSQEDASSVSMGYMQTCLNGQMGVDGGCVSCPAGTFHNAETEKCEFCDANTYQEDDEQSTCLPCPDNKVTTGTGSYNLALCVDKASQETIWSTTLIAVIGAAGGLVVLLILLIIILCCCRICCVDDDDFSDNIGNLTHLNKAYEEDDDQEMTFTGTMDNGRASVRTYQSIPGNGYAHHADDSDLSPDERLVRIPSMSASVYNYNYGDKNTNGDATHMGNGHVVPDSPPPPPPFGAPAPPPPPPPPPPV